MKNLMNFRAVAIAISFTVLAGASAFAADPSNALTEGSPLLSSNDFKALSEIPAEPMNEAELDKVQGKYTPDPECYSGCFSPWGPFPPRPWYRKILTLKRSIFRGMDAVAFNPQPEPPATFRGQRLF